MDNKHIVLGITGSIAAYKAASLVRLMIAAGWDVSVVMTRAATEEFDPEQPIVAAILQGDRYAFDDLSRRNGDWVRGVIYGPFHRPNNMLGSGQVRITHSQINNINALSLNLGLFPINLLKKIGRKLFQSFCIVKQFHIILSDVP